MSKPNHLRGLHTLVLLTEKEHKHLIFFDFAGFTPHMDELSQVMLNSFEDVVNLSLEEAKVSQEGQWDGKLEEEFVVQHFITLMYEQGFEEVSEKLNEDRIIKKLKK